MEHLYGIIGAGGHGRETMPHAKICLVDQIEQGKAALYYVAEGIENPQLINGVPLISLNEFRKLPGPHHFNIAIRNSGVRERLATSCLDAGMEPFTVVAANAMLLKESAIGVGAIFSPFSLVTSNTSIGDFFHGNMYSYVAHDCIIGNFVTFGPGVKCNGKVTIEDHVYVGAGAVIKEGTNNKRLHIGRGACIGMGAVVTRDVPPGVTVVGNPARLLERS